MREGAQHFHLRNQKQPTGRVRQFIHGLALPFHLARALLADPIARGRYIQVGLLQTIAAVALALAFMFPGKEVAESARDEAHTEERARRRALRQAARALVAQQALEAHARAGQQVPPLPGDAGVDDSLEDPFADAPPHLQQRLRDVEAAARRDGGTSLPEAIAALLLEATAHEDEDEDEEEEGAVLEDGGTAVAAGDGEGPGDAREGVTPATEDGGTAAVAQGQPSRSGDGASGKGPGRQAEVDAPWWKVKGYSLWTLAFWATLFATLGLSQWVVIALSREYHDAISRDASLLSGVEPEDPENTPRLRLDMAWVRKKVQRRWRAFVLFAWGAPLLWLLTVPVCCNSALLSVLTTAWAAWWLMVFTAAKSSHAWELPTPAPRPPWFLRAWTWLTTHVPGFRWFLPRRYGAFMARRTQEVLAPIATAERHPWAFAGLTVVRFISAVPPMKFFLRPLIPVAAAHLLAQEAAERARRQPDGPRPVIPAGVTGS